MAQRHNCGVWVLERRATESTAHCSKGVLNHIGEPWSQPSRLVEDGVLWEEYPELFVCEPPTYFKGVKNDEQVKNQNVHYSVSSTPACQDPPSNKLLHLTNSIQDVLWTMDRDCRVTYISHTIERVMGYTPDEFMRLPIHLHFPESFSRKFSAMRRKLLHQMKNGQSISPSFLEFQWLRKDGRKIWVETDISPLFGKFGEIEGLTGSIRDVTNRMRRKRELEQEKEAAADASQAKSDFLADMSHEIRTPMNGVLGILQILKYTDLSAEQNELVDTAVRSGKNLVNLISDILDLSKIEARKMKLEEEDVELHSLLDAVVAECKPLITSPSVRLSYTIHEDVPQNILTDATKLRQILTNLLSNAIKFTEEGEVTVKITHPTLVEERAHLSFTVEDSGTGISSEAIQHLFKPFVQADAPLNPDNRSTGLGLRIVRQLVELMGGTVHLESEKDRGTTISFNLPVRLPNNRPQPIATVATVDSQQAVQQQDSLNILVVEDEKINALVVSAMLQHIGHTVTHVTSGFKALEILQKEKFDCILMDIQLPQLDGIETSRAIRSSSKVIHPEVPIIALTAHAMKGNREEFLSAGMNAYLTKPLHLNDLNNVLQRVFEQ